MSSRCLSPVFAALLLLPACDGGVGGDSGEVTTCREPPLSYENFGRGVMDRHCTGCHSSFLPEGMRGEAPVGVNLNTYEDVLVWADRIEARATGNDPTMPPGGGPTSEEVDQLEEWLQCVVYPELEEGTSDGAEEGS